MPSRTAVTWTSLLVSSVLGPLTSYHLDHTWVLSPDLPRLPNGLQLWIDRQGSGWKGPDYTAPSPAHLAAAEQLIKQHLEQAGEALVTLCSDRAQESLPAAGGTNGGVDEDRSFKLQAQSLLCRIGAVLVGTMSRLREFEGFPGMGPDKGSNSSTSAAVPLRVVGWLGPPVGGIDVRNRAAKVLTTAMRHLRGGDRELLEQCLSAAMVLLSSGMTEQMMASQMGRPHQTREDLAVLEEPAAATAFLLGSGLQLEETLGFNGQQQEQAGSEEEGAVEVAGSWGDEWRWRKRTNLMSALERVRRMWLWRTGLSAGRVQLERGRVDVEPTRELPLEYLDLVWEVVQVRKGMRQDRSRQD